MPKRSLSVLAVSVALVAASAYGSAATVERDLSDGDPVRKARYALQVFDDSHGLPQTSVLMITVDRSGYLWVGTQDGAASYNGREWTPFPMPHRRVSNYVNAILVASDGSFYFGTNNGGVARLLDGSWTIYDKDDGLTNEGIYTLLERRDAAGRVEILAGTADGVSVFDGASWAPFYGGALMGSRIHQMIEVEDAEGKKLVWAATQHGLARFDGASWRVFGTADGLADENVHCVTRGRGPGRATTVLAGTEGGLVRVDGDVVEPITPPSQGELVVVRSLLESENADGSSTLWVGTIHGGLLRLENGVWFRTTTASGLPATEVSSLFETTSARGARTLWIGTNGGGLARCALDRWRSFDVHSLGLNMNAMSFCETSGERGSVFWMGLRGALVRYDSDGWRRVDLPERIDGPAIKSLLVVEEEGREVLWAGSGKGLGQYSGGRWRVWTTRDGLPGDEILGLFRASDGGIWVCTHGGIARIDGSVVETYTPESGLPHIRVQCLVETPAPGGGTVLWVGTDGGLARREAGRWTTIDTSSGLVNNVVLSALHETYGGRNRLWVTTFGGVSSLDLSSPDARWERLDDETDPALPNNTVYQVEVDRAGRLYFTTNRGVARLDRAGEAASIYTFTTADGLPANECEIGGGFVDRRGRVWVSTVKGAAVLDPAVVEASDAEGRLVVEKTLVAGTARGLSPDDPLPHDANSLTFQYALLDFFRESDTRYRTQLVGFDEEPTPWSADGKRDISNLHAGAYVFRVWARDHSGFVSGPVEVEFRIAPAPWRTWWAYSIYAGAALAAVFGVSRLRTRALRHKNELLESRIRNRTEELAEKVHELEASERRALEASSAKSRFLANMSHELRTPLNAILGFVQLMERSPGRSDADREHLTVIARSGEHLLTLINDVLSLSKIEAGRVVLSERVFDLPAMIAGLEEMFRFRVEAKNLHFLCEIDGEMPRFVRGDEGKLRQVLVNLLGNALKFTETGGVALRARCDEQLCSFEVEDTGPGIAPAELDRLFEAFVQTESGLKATEGTGLGLVISRSYVRLMGGEISVESEQERGTRFRVVVPLTVAEGPDHVDAPGDVVSLVAGHRDVRVLVVDDRWENRKILVELLAPVGFAVREAADGAAAVEAWKEWAPHVVWMDIKMPSVDGYAATRRIRELEAEGTLADRPRTLIIAVTASAFAHERDAILEAGCDDFVPKPFRSTTIFEKMAEHLGVRYAYGRPGAVDETEAARGEIAASRFASIPPHLVADLGKAIVQGDVEGAYRAADAISSIDAELGEELRTLIRSYRFDDIQELVTRV